MSLDTQRLFAHLMKASKTKPTMPNSPAIKQAEKPGQQAKQAAGVNKVEKEIEKATKDADRSSPDAKAVAEAYLSKALMKKLTTGEKLSADEQKQVAAVCKTLSLL